MDWLRALHFRLLSLCRRRDLEADMAEEIRSHLECERQARVAAGMAPEEAAMAARQHFGGMEQMKEHCRDVRSGPLLGLEHLARDLRFAVRQMGRQPGVTAVIVLSLAIGIGATTAAFSQMGERLLGRLSIRHPEELVLFSWIPGPNGRPGSDGGDADRDKIDPATGRTMRRVFSQATFDAFRVGSSAVTDVFAVAPVWRLTLATGDRVESLGTCEAVSGAYFSVLGVTAAAGRVLVPSDDAAGAHPVAVLSYEIWQRLFDGDPAIVGRTVRVNLTAVTIVGVAARSYPGILGQHTAAFLPLSLAPTLRSDRAELGNDSHWWMRIMGRLRPGATLAQAEASLSAPFAVTAKAGMTQNVALPRLHAASGGYRLGEAERAYEMRPLSICAAIAVLVFLAACTNAANLLLERGAARRRELAVRMALGSGRGRLVRQLLTESVLLALFAAALGAELGVGAIRWLSLPLPGGSPPAPNVLVLGLVTGFAVVTGIAFGLLPALRATRIDLVTEFQGGPRTLISQTRVHRTLLALQIAFSLTLLVGAGLFLRTVHNLRTAPIGFDSSHLLLFGVDATPAGASEEQRQALYETIRSRIGAMPGAVQATMAAWPLLFNASGWGTDAARMDSATPVQADVTLHPIGLEFFGTYRIPVLAGRGFGEWDAASAPEVAIVNRHFAAQLFGSENPVGRRILVGGSTVREIVGLVGDVKHQDFREPLAPILYVPIAQIAIEDVVFTVRAAGDPAALAVPAREVVRSLNPLLPPPWTSTMEREIETNLLSDERSFAQLSLFLGVVALILVCVGLGGLMAYAVRCRTPEIGIRLALGADAARVARMILAEAMTIVAAGLVVGIAATAAISRVIGSMLYGLSPTDAATYAASAAVLLAMSALATALPARAAARVDASTALRCD